MKNIIVAGIGTGVGKTVISTILSLKYKIGYWKPIECGDSDSDWVKKFSSDVYEPAYRFKQPVSPHRAAAEENMSIGHLILPTKKPLVIEMAGGVLVPLRLNLLAIDHFAKIDADWIVVSKNYLGSINHTLLTLEAIAKRGISVHALVFNGPSDPDSEKAICTFSNIQNIERIPEEMMDLTTLKKYGTKWTFGIPTRP